MSSTEHDELKHASEMLAKLQAHHRARADELHTACEAQRECTASPPRRARRRRAWKTSGRGQPRGARPLVITTHVLDTAARPAGQRHRDRARACQQHGIWNLVGGGITDDDGRLRTLTPPGPVDAGRLPHPLRRPARTSPRAARAGFFPVVEIQFTVDDGAQHYHVPLLLSPFGFSTYRGS